MANKNKIIIGVVAGVLIIIGALTFYMNYNPYKNSELDPIYSLVKIQYFNEGTYDDFQALFLTPANALTEEQFNDIRKTTNLSELFPYGSDSPKNIMEHMKAVQEESDAATFKIFYLNDLNDTKEMDTASYWLVTNKDGKWLIKND